MSKFTVKPYIETVLSEVSGENKAKLLNFINGKGADGTGSVSYTLVKSESDFGSLSSGITAVDFKFNPTITWKGYFIKTTNHAAFITFKNGIDLWLASVYKFESSKLVPVEKLTADNIRALLREDAYIDASELPEAGTIVEANPETIPVNSPSLSKIKIGDVGFSVFDPTVDDASYMIGKIFSRIRVSFLVDGTNYEVNVWQLVNQEITFAGINEIFDNFRDGGMTIPTVNDNTSFTNALNIVYTANPELFLQLVLAMASLDNYWVFRIEFSNNNGANYHTIFQTGDLAPSYIDDTGIVHLAPTLESFASSTISSIVGKVND